jgi:limonene-1,2-epoxide hydrolase
MSRTQADNLAAVRKLCERWAWLTREEFHTLMTPDCDYRNIPINGDKHIGPDEAHDILSRSRERWDIKLDLLNITATGDVVMAERMEHFKHLKGTRPSCDLPVMGVFEMRDGKIAAWRDYFEMSQAAPLMGPPPQTS